MSPRRRTWLVALPLIGVAAPLLGWWGRSGELIVPATLLGLSLAAMIAEVLSLGFRGRAEAAAPPIAGLGLGDGLVAVVPMAGVRGRPLEGSPPFREFLDLIRDDRGAAPEARKRDSRPRLVGQVALVSVFVGRDGVGWSDEEVVRGLASVERAGAWIGREAIRHSAPLHLRMADTFFRARDDEDDEVEVSFGPEGDDVGPMEARASTKAIVTASRVAARMGFADFVELATEVGRRLEADALVWLIHVRRAGRSLAIPPAESEIRGLGLALCYSREESFPGPLVGPGRVDPVTVVHEMLHLFGASDKYGRSLASYPRGSVTAREIMRLNLDRLARMQVGPLTAVELGWLGILPKDENARG